MSTNEAAIKVGSAPDLTEFGRERLLPGAYYLDLSAVSGFPLYANGLPSTFEEVYRKLRNAKVLEISERFPRDEEIYVTDSGEVTITGGSGTSYASGQIFVLKMLRDLIELAKDGIDPERAAWFYYDHDWSRDADELFLFFIVFDGKIVRERLSLMHCDPRVLTKAQVDSEPIWHSEPYERAAWETYWYRKFYTEAPTGQLMVLRPDEPILYHYERTLVRDVRGEVQFVTVMKLYRFCWVAVPLLAAAAFPALKPYAAIFAGAAAIDLLWLCWTTRKVGREQ